MTIHITHRAKRLHKLLLLSAVSLSLLGLTGCTKSVGSTSLPKNLTHTELQSPSLISTIKTQFRPNVTAHLPNSRYLDFSNHDIGYFASNESDIATDKSLNAKYYATNGQCLAQIHRKEAKKNYVNMHGNLQTIHYHINDHKKTLTLSSGHYHNSLNWITYRLVHVKDKLGARTLTFKPVALKRFGQKPAKVSSFVGKYNQIKIKDSIPPSSAKISHDLKTHIKPYKIFHKPTLNKIR